MKKRRRPPQGALFRESLHDSLTDQLRGMILRHELKPGEWIQELQLCEALGVSRTPMREALKVLASERLVVLYPYRGASVAEIEPDAVSDLFEVQAILESQAGILACRRASDEDLKAYSGEHHRMLELFRQSDRPAYFALNQKLHSAVVTMARNACLADTHASIMTQIARARYAALEHEDRWSSSIEQHIAIHDALMARDSDAIAPLIRHHIEDTATAVMTALRSTATALPVG